MPRSAQQLPPPSPAAFAHTAAATSRHSPQLEPAPQKADFHPQFQPPRCSPRANSSVASLAASQLATWRLLRRITSSMARSSSSEPQSAASRWIIRPRMACSCIAAAVSSLHAACMHICMRRHTTAWGSGRHPIHSLPLHMMHMHARAQAVAGGSHPHVQRRRLHACHAMDSFPRRCCLLRRLGRVGSRRGESDRVHGAGAARQRHAHVAAMRMHKWGAHACTKARTSEPARTGVRARARPAAAHHN